MITQMRDKKSYGWMVPVRRKLRKTWLQELIGSTIPVRRKLGNTWLQELIGSGIPVRRLCNTSETALQYQ